MELNKLNWTELNKKQYMCHDAVHYRYMQLENSVHAQVLDM